MNSKNKNILLVICLFVILVIFLDLIFNFSSIVIENFEVPEKINDCDVEPKFCVGDKIPTKSIISRSTGKIFNISFYPLDITNNCTDKEKTDYIINIASPRSDKHNLAVNNDGTLSEVEINTSDSSQQFILREINRCTDIKPRITDDENPFYTIQSSINMWYLSYDHSNLYISPKGIYQNQQWDISTQLIKPFYTSNMEVTNFGQLRTKSDKEQLNSKDKIKINLNLNDDLKQKLFGLEEEENDTDNNGVSNSNKCPTYLPNKSIESLCKGCDVDKL